MRWARWMVGAIMALAGAALVAGCGARASAENHVTGRRLTVYVSLPLQGSSAASARAVLGGVELALDAAHGRVGRYRIDLRILNDATAQSGGWDPGQTSANARRAAADPSTIGYIGEVNSGATAVSIPLLNRAGIPQISPTSTAVGLTTDGPEALPGEPEKYYPTQRRTFVRVVPDDAVQAAVQVQAQRRRRMPADRRAERRRRRRARRGPSFVAVGAELRPARDRHRPVRPRRQRPRAGRLGGRVGRGLRAHHRPGRPPGGPSVRAPRHRRAGRDAVRLVGPGRAGLRRPRRRRHRAVAGAPASCSPTPASPPPSTHPSGRRFDAAYARRYGSPPPSAIYGYEAMSLLLDAIARATDGGRGPVDRSTVLAALLHTRDRHSVLGTYSIDSHGDTTLDRYGVYRVRDGRLAFWKAMSR